MSTKMGFEIFKKVVLPVVIFLGLVGCYLYYRITIVPLIEENILKESHRYIGTLFIIALFYLIQRIVASVLILYQENIAEHTKSKLDDKLIFLLRKSIYVVLWIIAFVLILPLFGVNINALIATLGVGSLAIALAAQDTISNIIAGFLILIDTPFRIGDTIKLPSGEIVEVIDVGIRRSKFLSEDKSSVIIMPNLDLSKSKIINYSYASELSSQY